jgi:hypothetical protein
MAMEPSHEIQQAIGGQSTTYESVEKSKKTDIQQAVDSAISDEAERTIRSSGQDLISKNLDPTGKYYPFRILPSNKYVERVVVDWFMVSPNHRYYYCPFLSIGRSGQISKELQENISGLFLLTRDHIYYNGF